MQFDKPKVTIDLEEYQFLKEKSENLDLDKMTVAAKKILWYSALAMSTGRGNIIDVKASLLKEGIMIITSPYSTTATIHSWESMEIKFEADPLKNK